MAGRTGALVAFIRRSQPPGPPPSGWALAFDVAVAVGAAAGAVYEMAERTVTGAVPVGIGVGRLFYGPEGPFVVQQYAIHPTSGALVAAAMTALPLVLRRYYPTAVWLAIAAAIVAVHRLYLPPVALGSAVYAAYSAVTHSRYKNFAITSVSIVTIAVAGALGPDFPRFPGRLTAIFAIVPAAVAGLGIRELRRRLADSTARLGRAAADAKAATRRALAVERARIASELHDVVTHNVSVMIVQAGAARKIMASSPADAENALLAVEATGREAMTELRNLLGLLSPVTDTPPGESYAPAGPAGASPARSGAANGRPAGASQAGVSPSEGGAAGSGRTGGGPPGQPRPGGGSASFRPQPGLGELDALISRVSATGLEVRLRVSGDPQLLSPGANLAAYRVVQEALTNVLRHTGRAGASVNVDWGENLEITVSDRGGAPGTVDGAWPAGVPAGGDCGTGRGLLGLRERLALYGGELEAGPRREGGWQVRAVMPIGGLA